MQFFSRIIQENEDWLMDRVLFYAKRQNYTQYASTLKEAWRISIQGLSHSIIQSLDIYKETPELSPEEDFAQDILAQFGILEAHKHRERGINLSMFLGLFKYYRESYLDLVREKAYEKEKSLLFINRIFDRMEIAFCTAWSGISEQKKLEELQSRNRDITNEKNKYLTALESLATPIVLLGEDNRIEYINHAGCKLFDISEVPGGYYYHQQDIEVILPLWLKEIIKKFLEKKDKDVYFESLETQQVKGRYFVVQINRMLDVTLKFQGLVVVLYDITRQERIRQHNDQLQSKIKDRTRRLEKTLKNLKEKEEIQGVLLKEVNHRVKNNLAALISMLHMEQDREDSTGYHNLLEGLINRIQGLSTVHTMLSNNEWKSLNLTELCRQVIQGISAGEPFRKRLNVQIEPCQMEINGHQAHHFTLVLNELATNTIKYAFGNRDIAKIDVALKQMGTNIVVVFHDDGPGYPDAILKQDFSCTYVGFELIQGIVQQSLGGNVQFLNNNGAVAIIEFPLEAH